MFKKGFLLYILILLGVLIIAGCSKGNSAGQAISSAKTADSPHAEVSQSAPSGSVKEISIKAFRFGFEPDTLIVNKGDKVVITAESIDVPHGLAINEYNVNLYLDGATPKTTEFVADRAGTFTIYCSVPCGSGHSSMRGRLIVE